MKKNKIILAVFILVIILGFAAYLFYFKNKNAPIVSTTDKAPILKDGRQCYTLDHEATATEPYTVNEFLDITIDGSKVTGTKRGTQEGPDMTNGYSGTIVGTVNNDTINDIFSYTVEGSSNKEAEIYQARADQIGIEKLRYPLIEKGGVLVPDTTKEFTKLLYARVGCTGSN